MTTTRRRSPRPDRPSRGGWQTVAVDDDEDRLAAAEDDDQGAGRARHAGTRVPGWVFFVVPLLLVGGIVGAIAVAARSDTDEGGVEPISGPAADLPSVAAALDELAPAPDEPADVDDPATLIGLRVGAFGTGLVEVGDRNEFTREYGLLPDDGAEELGEALGALQRELSPTALGGPRGGDERHGDTVFALRLVWPAAQALDPSASPEQQALNVLPAAVPLADTGDEIVAAVVAGDMETAAELLEPVLSDAGAAEVVSGLAGDLSDRLGNRNEPDRLEAFQEAYNLELP